MKFTRRIISIVLVAVLCLSLASCGGSSNFKSIQTDKGKSLSLGDSKKNIEKILGEGDYDADLDAYGYLDNGVRVSYDSDEVASIMVFNNDKTAKFKSSDISFESKKEDIEKNYSSEGDFLGVEFFSRYLDNKGKTTEEGKATYTHALSLKEDGTINFFSITKFDKKD